MFNKSNIATSYKNNLKTLAVAGMTSLLIACGGGGAGEPDTLVSASDGTDPGNVTTIQGNAVKGVILNGLVGAYLVENQAGTMVQSSQALAELVRTDAQGAYQLSLPGSFADQTVIIEMTADSQTRMTCDVTEGCGLNEQGNPIAFGDLFSLSTDFSMKGAVVGVDSGDIISGHLSPLSHMAVAYAESSVSGLSAANISSAYRHIEAMMDLDSGALDLSPADITNLNHYNSLSKSEIEMGVISAAFLSLVNTPDWSSIEEVMTHIAAQMDATGELAAVNMGGLRDVALDDLFYNANEIVADIAQSGQNDLYSETLSLVSAETAASYQSVSEVPQEVDPVQFVSHPQSVTVDEGEQVQFSVAVVGGGSISFQWRKDGQNISGATSSSLLVSVTELGDMGTYDVIASNSVGSLTSYSALLSVNEAPEALASIELSWDIPEQREDGSDLELYEIEGYVISYGTVSGQLDSSITVTGGLIQTALIEELSANTYFFAIATVDSDGQQGAYSEEITQVL